MILQFNLNMILFLIISMNNHVGNTQLTTDLFICSICFEKYHVAIKTTLSNMNLFL